MGKLMKDLRKRDKNGIFGQKSSTLIGFPTGLLPFDFRNGYQVNVFDENNNVVKRWANIGLFGGSFITVCGKSGTAKTAFCVQVASNIIRNYDEGEIYHFDLEGSSNEERLQVLSGFSRSEMDEKYNYIDSSGNYIEDIFEAIVEMANFKIENKKDYLVDSGKLNSHGDSQMIFAPTVVIIDSIPLLVTKDLKDETGMASATYSNRLAKTIGQFYKRLRPYIKEANITVIGINHLNSKIDINPMQKTQAQLMYLKQDEAMPGGNSPIYLAQTLLKFVLCGKYTEEKDGFNGFAIRIEFLKSKTNRAGSSCTVIYDMKKGFDQYRTIIEFAKENGLLEGRNPYSYFTGHPELKFDSRKFSELCSEDLTYYNIAVQTCKPILYSYLGNADDVESGAYDKESEYMINSKDTDIE